MAHLHNSLGMDPTYLRGGTRQISTSQGYVASELLEPTSMVGCIPRRQKWLQDLKDCIDIMSLISIENDTLVWRWDTGRGFPVISIYVHIVDVGLRMKNANRMWKLK